MATTLDDFRAVDPLTREPYDVPSAARVLATPDALYIGFRTELPRAERRRARSPRDTPFVDADEMILIIDLEGEGKAAYEFAVSISGSVRDGTVLQQSNYNYDWDTVWYSAVAEDDAGWSVEMELPWTVAPLGRVTDGRRRIGISAGLWVDGTSRYYSDPANDYRSPTFVSDLRRIELPAYDGSTLDWIPYASSTSDLLDGSHRARAGLDVIWKPDAARQLTATVNPDFGQVESDDLVVNFSAVETFFTEKRPFFTQNQHLFDHPTTLDGRLIHTRRIGDAPDAGPEGQTDVLAAAKFSATHDGWEYGAFAVAEDDSAEADGRDYYAARLRRRGETWGVGWLGTRTERPALDRIATVHAVDAEYTPAPGWAVRAQAILTDPKDPLPGASARGHGAWLSAIYAPGGRLEQNLYLSRYDDDYDINDLGFMTRNDVREAKSATTWHRRDHGPESRVQSSHWRLEANGRTTDDGSRLPSTAALSRHWNFQTGSALDATFQARSTGIDDLTTRGGPAFDVPAQEVAILNFRSRRMDRWSWQGELEVFREGFTGTGYDLDFEPQLFVSENLGLSAGLHWIDRPDWLIWREEIARVARHRLRELDASLSANWYPGQRAELRVRLQWAGLRARVREVYDIAPGGALVPVAVAAEEFSRGELAAQLRFRYEFKPLSELFVVWSYGGTRFLDGDATQGDLWSAVTDDPDAQQLVVKCAWRF